MPNIAKVNVSQAVDLKYNHHLSYEQIAKIQGVTKQAIHEKIRDLLPIPETQIYIDHRADILASIQLKLLSNLDQERLKKASAYQLVGAAGLLYDKERLERGLSTVNESIHLAMLSRIEEAERQSREPASTKITNDNKEIKD